MPVDMNYTTAEYLPTSDELEVLDHVLTMNHGHVTADNRGNGLFIAQFIDLRENHRPTWRRGEATTLTHRHVQSLIAVLNSYAHKSSARYPGTANGGRAG